MKKQCPVCKQVVQEQDLIPYYGSGFTPADKAQICPFCGQISPLSQFLNETSFTLEFEIRNEK